MTAVGLPSQGVQGTSALDDFHAPSTERVMNSGGGGAPLELAPQGDFLRMDLEVAWPIAPRIGGCRTELRPYIKDPECPQSERRALLLLRPLA